MNAKGVLSGPYRMARRRSGCFLAIFVIVMLVSFSILTPAQADAGDFDLNFGIGGSIITDFSSSIADSRAVAIQNDNNIIIGGWLRSTIARTRAMHRFKYFLLKQPLPSSIGTPLTMNVQISEHSVL